MTDLPKIIHVKVTQECIDEGTPASYQSCPIALALVQLPELANQGISVLSKTVDVNYCNSYALPEEAQAFIEIFDGYEHVIGPRTGVTPFEFDMTLEPQE